jgi:beta-1,3-galactosyltransferase 1
MAVLRPFTGELVSRINVTVDSSALLHRFTLQNKTLMFGKYFGLSSKQIIHEPDNIYNKSKSKFSKNKDINTTADVRVAEFGPNVKSAAGMTYLMENKDLCKSPAEGLLVMIMVHTAPKNYNKRMAIRQTWANNSYYTELGTVQTLFLLGQVRNETLQREIEREFNVYGDLVQGDFVDSYYNITLKGIMEYKWLHERCQNVKIILKVDDDVIINMFTFLKHFAPTFLRKDKHMACRRLINSRIDRNKKSKWYVGESATFKNRNVYPPFCQGFAVVITYDAIFDLYKSSIMTPFFWIDDVFLYGLTPGKVPEMNYTNLVYGKTVIWGADKAINCYKRSVCNYLVVLLWSDIPNMMEAIWRLMQRQYHTSTNTSNIK